jgi:hypothetical protein
MLKLGTGSSIISPHSWEGVTMGGMPRNIPTRGVLEDLEAHVFVLQDGTNSVVICELDQLFITEELATQIGARTERRLPKARLILCATHDHSSEAIPFDAENGKAEKTCAAAREIIYEGFSRALDQALKDMREVEVAADRVPVPMALGVNRRAKLGNGTCTTAWDKGALLPPGQKLVGKSSEDARWIDLLAFREPGQAAPRALLSSYASHIHFYEVPYFTDEAAGASRRAMKKRHPHLHLMYAVGILGNIALGSAHPIPKNDEESRIAWYQEKSTAFGEAFADVLSRRLDGLKYAPVDVMRYETYREPGTEREQDLQIETLRLGSHAICVVPGEMFIEWDDELRRNQPCDSLLLMAFNRSFLGYVATPLGFEEGSYETMRGPVEIVGYLTPTERVKSGMNTGDFIVKKAREQVANLFQE